MLCGASGFSDLSETETIHTFRGNVFGKWITSKLDRFLSNQEAKDCVKPGSYSVDTKFIVSDHLLVSFTATIRCQRQALRPIKRKFPVLRPSNFSKESLTKIFEDTQTQMHALETTIDKLLCRNNVTGMELDCLFKCFTNTIHLVAKRYKRQRKKKCANRPLLAKLRKSLQTRRHRIRQLKFRLREFIGTGEPPTLAFFDALKQEFPSLSLTTSVRTIKVTLRKEIKLITERLKALYSLLKSLSHQSMSTMFDQSRSKFYDRFIRGSSKSGGLLRRIRDPVTQKLYTKSEDVKRVVREEACKIFQKETMPPSPEPGWFSDLYNPANNPSFKDEWPLF